jgi:Ca2+-binding EF-hand superfamily protein
MIMQISGTSTTYGSDQAQRLLAMLLQAPSGASGQEVPATGGDTDAAAPTPPAPDAVKLATDTLSGLLAAQQSRPSSASDLAQQMISALDTDGDGALSAAEITKALGADSSLSADQVTQAVNQLDVNGDGKLSADELATGVKTARAHGGGGHHHHHGHAAAASSSDVAAQLISGADSDGDGALSASELTAAIDAFRTAHQQGDGSNAAQAGVTA